MGCKNRNCLQCVWNLASTTGVTQKLSCTNSDYKIRKNFNDAASAETCKGYLEDDPNFQVKVVRDTRETLMKNIHQMAVNNGYYGQIEAILDYFSPDTIGSPKEITCDDFNVVTEVQFGGNEGIYLDCYAEGRIQPECEKKRWHIGTYKTLDTSISAMQILGTFGGTLTYYAAQYLWENGVRFLSERELRIRALQKRQKEREVKGP